MKKNNHEKINKYQNYISEFSWFCFIIGRKGSIVRSFSYKYDFLNVHSMLKFFQNIIRCVSKRDRKDNDHPWLLKFIFIPFVSPLAAPVSKTYELTMLLMKYLGVTPSNCATFTNDHFPRECPTSGPGTQPWRSWE